MKVRPLTFKDIEFKPHNVVKGGIQGLLKLPNNVTVSIVGGPTLYGDGVDTFEVAAWWGDHGDWIRLSNHDDVKGYVEKDEIDFLIFELSKK
jgi:hypothetical protein